VYCTAWAWNWQGKNGYGSRYDLQAVTEWPGVEESGGMVRVGIAHYNTPEEVERLLAVVGDLASLVVQ
jgi:selenocysteine lyase/cysteine desulfurase